MLIECIATAAVAASDDDEDNNNDDWSTVVDSKFDA